MRLAQLMLEDDPAVSSGIQALMEYADIEATPAFRDSEAKLRIHEVAARGGGYDVITTDLNHLEEGGMQFLRWLRGLPDEYLFHRILRARHVPVVVISALADGERREAILTLDRSIRVLVKPCDFEDIVSAVEGAISDYRHRMMSELDHVGIAVTYDGGRYRVVEAFSAQHGNLDTTYLFGSAKLLSPACGRLILALDRSTFAERGIEEFEWLLNHSNTTERDFQAFFTNHPEFILTHENAWYWSEPRLKNFDTGNEIRPDFILQPSSSASAPWRWTAIDLKSPHVPVLRSTRFHTDFTQHVYRVMTQLRDYSRFFADPANRKLLQARFGGVVPQPKLSAPIIRRSLGRIKKPLYAANTIAKYVANTIAWSGVSTIWKPPSPVGMKALPNSALGKRNGSPSLHTPAAVV